MSDSDDSDSATFHSNHPLKLRLSLPSTDATHQFSVRAADDKPLLSRSSGDDPIRPVCPGSAPLPSRSSGAIIKSVDEEPRRSSGERGERDKHHRHH